MFDRIMVVDDQEADQMLAKYAIRAYSPAIETIFAYDGVEALEVLAGLEHAPDVIFLDINMPRMNGFEFLDIYSTGSEEAPVVVMLTSSDQEKDRSKCAEYDNVTGYEIKPISVEVLQKLDEKLSS